MGNLQRKYPSVDPAPSPRLAMITYGDPANTISSIRIAAIPPGGGAAVEAATVVEVVVVAGASVCGGGVVDGAAVVLSGSLGGAEVVVVKVGLVPPQAAAARTRTAIHLRITSQYWRAVESSSSFWPGRMSLAQEGWKCV